MRKLFVTDLDGTLINKKYVSYDNQRYVKKLSKLGHCVAVATGRGNNGVEFLRTIYKIKPDYWIFLNGALIIDKDYNVIKHEAIPFTIVKTIIEENCGKKWRVSVETGFNMFCLINNGKNFPYDVVNPINAIDEAKNEEISLISMYYESNDGKYLDSICETINNEYGDKVVAYRNVSYIDVVPVGCSKGHGVNYVMEKENIPQESAFAIGDSWNDVSMFEVVDNSFTFKNAEEKLQKKTKYVVDSVADCIKNYVLKK